MVAYNVVRFRVKPGREDEFLAGQQPDEMPPFSGFEDGALIKTGERTYCFIGRWENFDRIVAARPAMISLLDRVRDTLEDLGGGTGVTDPVSGDAVIEYPASS
jgi:hypothetical protein